MRNLYTSLLTYKAKEGRTPLEEFTSGALADLLSRMDQRTLQAFLSLFRIADGTHASMPDGIDSKILSWDAEHSVWSHDNAWGRADIIGLVNDQPAIIIENKLAAAVGETQIKVYREALEGSPVSFPLLLFLTDTTEPPADFQEEIESTVVHGSARWSEVYRFFAARGSSKDDATAFEALSSEFATFLRLKGLHMDLMSTKDAAVLRLWMEVDQRVETTIKAIFDPVCSALAPWRKGTRGSRYSDKIGAYAYSADFRIDGKECWAYVEAGIIFPDVADWWATGAASPPHAFLLIKSYPNEVLPSLPNLSWQRSPDGDEAAIVADLHQLIADETETQARIARWTESAAAELKSALPKPR